MYPYTSLQQLLHVYNLSMSNRINRKKLPYVKPLSCLFNQDFARFLVWNFICQISHPQNSYLYPIVCISPEAVVCLCLWVSIYTSGRRCEPHSSHSDWSGPRCPGYWRFPRSVSLRMWRPPRAACLSSWASRSQIARHSCPGICQTQKITVILLM